MGNISDILKRFDGKLKLRILFDKKEFLEISIKDMNISVEVKNPLMVLDYGLRAMADNDPGNGLTNALFKSLKNKGYKIKLKYNAFEFDV